MGILYLSFDDGPVSATEAVLRVLAKNGALATFYLNSQAKYKPYETVKKIIAGKHALGNHGHDHNPMGKPGYRKTTPSEVKKDFLKTLEYYETLFKKNKDTFPGFTSARLPGDGRTFSSYKKMITEEIVLPHVGWDFEFSVNGVFGHLKDYDWAGLRTDKDKKGVKFGGVSAPKNVVLRPGHVVLFHDQHWINSARLKLLDRLLMHLKKIGYIFKPLDPLPMGNRNIIMPSAVALKRKAKQIAAKKSAEKKAKAAAKKPAIAR